MPKNQKSTPFYIILSVRINRYVRNLISMQIEQQYGQSPGLRKFFKSSQPLEYRAGRLSNPD